MDSILAADIANIRSKAPIILNLTNLVVMDLTANALLAIGASPIMAHEEEELEEMVGLCDSVVINSGTLDKSFIRRSEIVLEAAEKFGKPLVFDPVGAGATRLRSSFAKSLSKKGAVKVIRGNVSEIVSLFDDAVKTKGVDSNLSGDSWVGAVQEQSQRMKSVLTASGAIDYIFSQGRIETVQGGDVLMTKVTGMGCTASSLIGAFLAVNPSANRAAVHAMTVMGIAGEIAGKNCKGPGSFRTSFLDALWGLK